MFSCNSKTYINAVSSKFALENLNKQMVWNVVFFFHGMCLLSCIKLCIKDWRSLYLPAGCPMSDWSVWSVCSCVSQRQQRYRVALSPALRGQQCTPVEAQSRSCSLSQCAGELKSMLTKMQCIFLHFTFYVHCFLLLTSNGFHINIVPAGLYSSR